VGKCKANELTSPGDFSEPNNRRPALGAGSAPLPNNASAIVGEHTASRSWQLVSPKGGVTYVAALAGSVAPLQPNSSLKATATGPDPSEPAVSPKAANRHMSSNMSGPLSDKPDGTTISAQVM